MNHHFNKNIFERFSFTKQFTALLFFPLVGQWPANHRMLKTKCLSQCEEVVNHMTFIPKPTAQHHAVLWGHNKV